LTNTWTEVESFNKFFKQLKSLRIETPNGRNEAIALFDSFNNVTNICTGIPSQVLSLPVKNMLEKDFYLTDSDIVPFVEKARADILTLCTGVLVIIPIAKLLSEKDEEELFLSFNMTFDACFSKPLRAAVDSTKEIF